VRSSWWAEAVGPGLAGLTEGAWIFVAYLALEAVAKAPSPLGPGAFVSVAVAGALAGAWLERSAQPSLRWIGLLSIGLAVIGTLAAPELVRRLLAGDVLGAAGSHPGGWLLGIAAFRGAFGGRAIDDPDQAGRPLARSIGAVVFIWLYAGLLPDPARTAFAAAALGPTLLFITAGIASLALRRVESVALRTGLAWWRNRAWILLVGALLGLLTAAAVQLGQALTTAVPAVLNQSGFPEVVIFVLFVASLISTRDRPPRPGKSAIRGIIGLVIVVAVVAILYRLLHGSDDSRPAAAAVPGQNATSELNWVAVAVLVAAILIGLVLIAILTLRKRRPGRPGAPAYRIHDESGFAAEGPGLSWLRRARDRFRRNPTIPVPATAEAAYLATLNLLEALADGGRRTNETPAAHAQRLHRQGSGSLELELLAADYELSRWGARQLPARETRRAVNRWDRSRIHISAQLEAERLALEAERGRGSARA
jgi:hypothetical protein